MLSILSDRSYRHLFMAQIIALIGTGLATVALGLLAYGVVAATELRKIRKIPMNEALKNAE